MWRSISQPKVLNSFINEMTNINNTKENSLDRNSYSEQ